MGGDYRMYRPAGLCLGEILPFTKREALLIRVLYRIIDIIGLISIKYPESRYSGYLGITLDW